jgi:hypothetical protein
MESSSKTPSALGLILNGLQQIPFIEKVSWKTLSARQGGNVVVEVLTSDGLFKFQAMHYYSSYLGAKDLDRIEAWGLECRQSEQDAAILIARYVSAPAAQRLLVRRINFVDAVGNCHLELGGRFYWTRFGIRDRPPKRPAIERDRVKIQLLLQFACDPAALAWTVRRLAESAGVSKSAAALTRRRLDPKHLATDEDQHPHEIITETVVRSALTGYGRVVRPKFLLNSFRPTKSTVNEFLHALRMCAEQESGRYAISGRSAAQLLGQTQEPVGDIPIFVQDWHRFAQRVQLDPDPRGPIILLRAFGPLVYGKEVHGYTVVPTPLIIAELLTSKAKVDQKLAAQMWKDFWASEPP